MSGITAKNIQSTSQREVAMALSEMLIETIADSVVAGKLRQVRDVVWADKSPDDQTKNVAFAQVLEGLTPEGKKELFESYQRMGELYELAGMTARDNFFSDIQKNGQPAPGGVREFAKDRKLEEVLDALSKPVFETTMTMHPTNIQGIEPMKALRSIAKILHERNLSEQVGNALEREAGTKPFDTGEWNKRLQAAMRVYHDAPILHQANGKEDNLTVRDETKTVLNYLGNIYEDMPELFNKFDRPLVKEYGFRDYDPLALHLNARFGSWGSAGDKDGNDKVTAEKTLEALVRHTDDIVKRYNDDLKQLSGVPELADWKGKLKEAQGKLDALLLKSEQLTNDTDAMRADKTGKTGNPADYEEKFNEISGALAKIRKGLDAGKFERDLTNLARDYKGRSDGDAVKLTDMVRKVRWFEFNFAKVEYRETAEEYDKVMNQLMPGYSDKKPQERVEQLTELLTRKEGLPADLLGKVQEALSAGAGKPLSDKDDHQAITYHTLKRMELGRDHNGMIRDNVLAECGALDKEKYPNPEQKLLAQIDMPEDQKQKLYQEMFSIVDKPEMKLLKNHRYDAMVKAIHPEGIRQMEEYKENIKAQGVANILEAQLLQRLVDKEGKKAHMGIVPLFEDPSTMQAVDGIMGNAYKNQAYHEHLETLKGRYGNEITQQVQIAHSDNRRRSGSLAGTALIHEAHSKLRQANEDSHVKLQFFEGGSMSDAYRNGVRSVTAQVNAYGLQEFAKFTFQGRDLQNYFNHPSSIERLFTRNFVHSAEHFANKGESVDESSMRIPNKTMNEVAIAALKRTLPDYVKTDFTKEAMGTLLAALGEGYDRESKAGNRGSRAADRVAFGSVAKTEVGTVIQPIAVDKLRTIPFSMMPQQNRLSMAWIGGQNLERYLREEIQERLPDLKKTLQDEVQNGTLAQKNAWKKLGQRLDVDFTKADAANTLTHEQWVAVLYEKAPAFRDAMDKSAFAVARTDITAVQKDIEQKSERYPDDKNAPLLARARQYAENLGDTFATMGNIVHAALTGKSIAGLSNAPNSYARYRVSPRQNDEQAAMNKALDDITALGAEIALKNSYQDFALFAKSGLGKKNELDDHDLAILSAAGLTVNHSRFLMADDPKYGRNLAKARGGQQEMSL